MEAVSTERVWGLAGAFLGLLTIDLGGYPAGERDP